MGTHYSTVGPICPHCDHQHRADEEFYFDEHTTEMQCERCERDFGVVVSRSTIWATQVRS